MAVDERARHQLHDRLAEVLGIDEAARLIGTFATHWLG